ncbi:MAG: DUF58 domain-containing protein, partial [Pseudonocardiaceae bacterium]
DVAAWDSAGHNPFGAARPDPTLAARLLGAAGWSVTVARPEQPLSSVWERLCISSRSKRETLR